MSDTIETLRTKVRAAQALAAKAPKRPWKVYKCDDDEWVIACSRSKNGPFTTYMGVVAELTNAGKASADLLAAAPDLVTLAADLLAALEAAQTERDEARAELTAICTALGDGADEAAWPPGLTVVQAVERLRGENGRLRTFFGTGYPPPMRDSNGTGFPLLCGRIVSEHVLSNGAVACRLCLLPAGHEGPHTEALTDAGDTDG